MGDMVFVIWVPIPDVSCVNEDMRRLTLAVQVAIFRASTSQFPKFVGAGRRKNWEGGQQMFLKAQVSLLVRRDSCSSFHTTRREFDYPSLKSRRRVREHCAAKTDVRRDRKNLETQAPGPRKAQVQDSAKNCAHA